MYFIDLRNKAASMSKRSQLIF